MLGPAADLECHDGDSHIFCTECAARLGLTNASGRHSCPACSSPLTNPDDAVVTNLNPSEDYKTSVLSGLSPNVIIECTSRALSFWAYQTIQEVVYQEYLGKTLTEKYTDLTVHLDKVISEANAQITALNNKIANLSFDQQSLRRKNDEVAQAFREKNKKLMQTQELYDRLKRKAMMGQMQHAAEDAVDSNLYSNTELGARGPGLEPARLSPGLYAEADTMYRQARQQANTQGGNDMYSAQVSNQPNLGAWGKAAGGGGFVAETHSPRYATNTRPPLNDMTGNIGNAGKFPAVGLSSGLKTSHNGGGYNGFAVPTRRPQGNITQVFPSEKHIRFSGSDSSYNSESTNILHLQQDRIMSTQINQTGSADLRIATTTVRSGPHGFIRIPRKPVAQDARQHRSATLSPGKVNGSNSGSSQWTPKSMEQTQAQAPPLVMNSQGAQKESSYKTALSAVYGRGSKKNVKTNKLAISAPVQMKVPPTIPDFQAPAAPMPKRPARMDVETPGSTTGARQTHAGSANKTLPLLPLHPSNFESIQHAQPHPDKISRGPSEWKMSNPVSLPQTPQAKPLEEGRLISNQMSPYPARPRFNVGNWSWSADYGDDENGPVADWSEDDKEADAYPKRDATRKASIEAVVNGGTVSDDWPLSNGTGYVSFPEPSLENAGVELTKQSRRQGRIFSAEEISQFPDASCLAGEEYDDGDEFLDAGFDEESEVIDLSLDEEESAFQVDDSDESPHRHQIDIKITPPTPPLERSPSFVSNKYLTPDYAWKRIAERCHREASRSRDEAEQVLEHCLPLMKAFDLIKSHTEFSHLNSWDGAYQVLEMILEDRKYSATTCQQAQSSARWFHSEWQKDFEQEKEKQKRLQKAEA
ncbi:hypothetical protein SCUP515_09971 [Seiridium cupressi]